MTKIQRTVVLGIALFAAAFAAACPARTSIADISANPSKYSNKDVAIAGTVQDSYGVSIPGTPIRGGHTRSTTERVRSG